MPTRRATLALIAALPALAACGGGADGFTIGYQKNGVLLAAKNTGIVERALAKLPDAAPSWAEFASGPPLLEALGAGAVHLGQTGDLPTIFAQAGGADLLYVAALPLSGRSAAILLPPGSPVRTVADLRGRKVAYTRGSSGQTFVAAALARAGLSIANIEPVDLAPPDAAAAFAGRRVDAWAIWDPYYAAAEIQGARTLVTSEGVATASSFILANRRYTERRPEVIRATLDAIRAAGEGYKTRRAELGRIFAQEVGGDARVQMRVAERQDLDYVPMTDAIASRHQALADGLLTAQAIPRRIDVAAAVWKGWTPA